MRPRSPYGNVASSLTGRAIEGLTTLGLLSVLGHYLGGAVLGNYYYARSCALLTLACADLGLSRFVMQRLAGRREAYRGLFGRLLAMRVWVYCASAGALLVLTASQPEPTRLAIWAFVAGLFCSSITDLCCDVLRADEDMRMPAMLSVVQRIAYGGAAASGVISGFGLPWVLGCFIASNALQLIATVLIVTRRHGRFLVQGGYWQGRELLSSIGPFTAAMILGAVNARIGAIVLHRLSDEVQVGWYGAAMQFTEAVLILAYAANSAVFPSLSRLYRTSRSDFSRGTLAVLKLGLVFVAPVSVCGWFAASSIMSFLYGPEFVAAGTVLRIVVCAVAAMSFNTFLTTLLQAAGRPGTAALLTLCLMAFHLLGLLLLVPGLGAEGAALGAAIAEGAFLLLQSMFARHLLSPGEAVRSSWRVALGLIGMLATMVVLSAAHVLLRIVAGVLVYASVLAVLRPFAPSEVAWLRAPSGGDEAQVMSQS